MANAVGISVDNAPTAAAGNPVGGTIVNSGTLNVVASAAGGVTATTVTNTTADGATTTVVTTHPASSANATGIAVAGGANNLTISNSGSINVDAITANGGAASATGIRVAANGTVVPAAGDVLTINNSGDIIARFSMDGGTTFHRGTAIDVSEAPNRTVINLLGGNVTGDINVQDGDSINVLTDETVFNGVINAGCFDADAIAAGGNSPDLSACGVGTLAIGDGAEGGGNLHLPIDAVDGPSYAFVDTFTVNAEAR
jgi:hypothetical protein